MSEITIALGPNGSMQLAVPSPVKPHHIEIPFTEGGMKMLRKILSSHAKGEGRKISQPANPTQWQVEQWLKADRLANEQAKREKELAKEAADAQARAELFAEVDLTVEIDL